MAGTRASEEQDSLEQLQQLFEDLRKVKDKIEDHLLTASDVPFSKNTNEVKQKLDEIRAEYSSILSNVEKSYKEIKSLQEIQESIKNKDKSEIELHDSTYVSNIRKFDFPTNNNDCEIKQPKSTLVYQLKTETNVLIEGHKPDEHALTVNNSKIKLHNSTSESIEESTTTRRANGQYQTERIYKSNKRYNKSEERETVIERSPSDSRNIVNLEAENKNLEKQIIHLQEDLLSIKSDISPPLAVTDRLSSPQEWKEGKPYSKHKGKINKLKSDKHESKHKGNNGTHETGHTSSNHRHEVNSNATKKPRTFNDGYYSSDDEKFAGPMYAVSIPSSTTSFHKNAVGPVKHSVGKMIHKKQDNKSIMSIVTNDEQQTSKMNLAMRRSSTPDSLKKKMDLKEKEIQSLKDALKAAEKSNYKEADRLRTAKLTDDISDKLLHKSHECDELLEENIKLRKTIDELGIEFRDLELANLQLKNAKDSLEITKEKNAEENADLMNRVQLLQDELEKCHEVNDLKDQLSANLTRVMSELKDCQNSNKDQKNRLNLIKKDKDSKISELEKKIEDLKTENQEYKSKRKELEDKNKSLEKKTDELKKIYKRRLSDQADRLKSAETKAAKLQEKIPSVDMQKDIEDLKRANKLLNDDIKQLKEQNSSLQDEKSEISKEKDRCEKVLNTIANENDILKNEKRFNDCACRDLENELALLKSEKMRLEHILNSTNARAMELNENKNQLINSLDALEQQKMNMLRDLELANQELARMREDNYQLDLKYQQLLLEPRDKCSEKYLKDDESNDVEQCDEPSTHSSAKPCSPPGNSAQVTENSRGYEFSINGGIRKSKFRGPNQNKSSVESSAQVFALAIPTTEGEGRLKGDCKKRLPPKKKC